MANVKPEKKKTEPPKSLFNDEEMWTDAGRKLDAQVEKALRPIIERWEKKGYDTYHISEIVHSEVASIMAQSQLERMGRSLKGK